ncbi:VRR-NUC domain-containing protein [Stutzerimonas azotifigens]|uniref:VRR-NUC domain-containing protein n=1 Tax=Stutzerimonas azotifigens TaxID=291995 RepID=UPI0004218CA5|nr:VRR-NUC domain-containing protein [Stutzerimonas azotifigens]
MRQPLENPFYYLDNFQQVLRWVGEHHGDLLLAPEQRFLEDFPVLPQASRALLVRMVMRKGELFRTGKLRYAEIGCPRRAAAPLAELGWIDPAPPLSFDELFVLLKKDELLHSLGALALRHLRKAELYAALCAEHAEARPFADWCGQLEEQVLRVRIGEFCERLRLMFFGNLRQDWTEFVLADLGIFRYEQVPFSASSRAFRSRRDIDDYLHLQRCRERFEAGDTVAAILAEVPQAAFDNDWLESRRGKLLLRLGQQLEREGELAEALRIHAGNRYPGARERAIRVLERLDQPEAALALASQAAERPESEAEAQQLARILPRLRRTLGGRPVPRARPLGETRLDLVLPFTGVSVEHAVRDHLGTPDKPVHYVENTLINSLLGLLCWEAVFAPLPGAFFHPFHSGPADLASPDFFSRRAELFEHCLSRLDSGDYHDCIRRTFAAKFGLQSPFVAWGLLDEALLEQALACLPAAHLKAFFRRILADVPANRSGLPDLIQFDLAERSYRLIEVKGPGDRLQDNQKRWLAYAAQHGIPVTVCYVQWAEA